MTVVPFPEGDGLGDEEGIGLAEGAGVSEGFGVAEGFGVGEDAGLPDGDGDADGVGVTEGEGLGKLAATEKELPVFPALLENKPKTDSLRAIRVNTIKNDERKYVRLIQILLANSSIVE